MKNKEKLYFKDIEIRSEEKEGKKIVIGIIPYNSRSVEMWGITEIIAPTAFNKTLSDGAEVKALINHDDGKIIGSTRAGTLNLENTDSGLICTVELPNTSYANDLYEVITRGDCKTLSFGFYLLKFQDDIKGKTRTLQECQLIEISYGVPFPAYEETNSISYMRGLEKVNINLESLNQTLEKDNFDDNDKINIKNTIDILNGLINKREAADTDGEPASTTPIQDTSNNEKEIENKEMLQLEIEAEINL